MGIIIQQSIRSTVYSYVGALLGFLTVWFMNRLWLTPEQNGLLNVIISISLISSSLSNLGMAGVVLRMFPHFRNPKNRHGGFLFYPLAFTAIGSLLFLLIYWIFKDDYIARNEANSQLLSNHLYFLLPLTFFLGIFNVLDAFTRALFLSTAGVVIKEVLLRIVILLAAIAYHWNFISFEHFVVIYFSSFCVMALAMMGVLIYHKEWHWKRPAASLTKEQKKEIRDVALFSVITGLSGMMISSIDKVIVNDKLGLAAAGIFAVATYFGSMIQIPARSVIRISTSVIAESWKTNDLDNIRRIYRQSCLNQLIIGLLLLLALWVNIDSVIALMPAEYSVAKYVILFMGIGYLIDLATGSNGAIIGTSKYYRYDTLFMVLLVIFTFITNIVLIPHYGIVGSAIASCLTYALFNIMRIIFIRIKFNMQPYTTDFIKVLAIGAAAYTATVFIPYTHMHYLDIAIRGSIMCAIYGALILLFKVSPEISLIARSTAQRFIKK
ncbi:MAG: polysaccharide biosynthesis C-terminal domain-containing protein [Flavobacteriales bacterium]